MERSEAVKVWAFIVSLAMFGGLIFGTLFGNMTGPKYEFQSEVHGFMENAYWANTPELMIDQLEKCMDGMRSLGLAPDMYGKYWSWEQTPDWRMDYCYAHLEAIIDRCEEVIAWRDNQDLESGQMADVYNEKMENLRLFLKDGGWSDEIAKNAYYIEYHAYFYIGWIPVIALSLIMVGLVFARLIDDGEYGWYVIWIICSILVGIVGAYLALGR